MRAPGPALRAGSSQIPPLRAYAPRVMMVRDDLDGVRELRKPFFYFEQRFPFLFLLRANTCAKCGRNPLACMSSASRITPEPEYQIMEHRRAQAIHRGLAGPHRCAPMQRMTDSRVAAVWRSPPHPARQRRPPSRLAYSVSKALLPSHSLCRPNNSRAPTEIRSAHRNFCVPVPINLLLCAGEWGEK